MPASRRIRWAQSAVGAFFLANGTVVGAWAPQIPDRARALHLSTAALGGLLLCSGLGAVLAMPAAGLLIGRLGSRMVSRGAGLFFPLALAGLVLAPSPALLGLALLGFGLTGGTMDVAMNAHGIAVETQLGRRTVSLFHGLWSTGAFVGSALTSSLLAHGVRPASLVLATSAALAALLASAGCCMLSHREEGAQDRAHALRPHGRLLLLGGVVFISLMAEGSIGDWSAVFLRAVRHLGPGVVGYGYTAFAAATVGGRLLGDRVVSRLGESRTLFAGAILAALGLGVVLAMRALSWDLAGFILVGAGIANASPILYRTAGRVPGVPPGAGLATAVGIGYAGLLAGPPALGFLGQEAGVSRIFVAVIGLCLLLAAASSLVRIPDQPSPES